MIWEGRDRLVTEVTVTQVSRSFADYVNRVAYRRESFMLVRGNKPVAELRPLPLGARLSELPSVLASLPQLSVAEADDFAQDLEAAHAEIAEIEVRDPWQS
jgi:antitoxin (DNA-binding transcriptional repressor) of toxin-antitoxin stability system